MKMRLLCSALMLSVVAAPAMADIVVSFDPTPKTAVLGSGTFSIDIVADIPGDEPIVGWGLDLDIVDPNIAILEGTIQIGPSWTPAALPTENEDLDGLAGLAFPSGVTGTGVLLATVYFTPVALGTTDLLLSDDNATGDLTEGFALEGAGAGFANVIYNVGQIHIVPEPAALALMLVAGALLRRR